MNNFATRLKAREKHFSELEKETGNKLDNRNNNNLIKS